MATVKFSKELKESIVQAAVSVFSGKRVAAARLDTHWTAQSLVDFAYWPILDLLKQPDIQPFISKVTMVRVQQLNDITPWETFAAPSGFIPCPKSQTYYRRIVNADESEGRITASYRHDTLALDFENIHAVNDLKQAITERDKRVAGIKAQQDEFTKVVRAVLDTYSTLAPALKAWPPLWELLDEGTKAKHREVTTRAKPEKPVLDADLDAATRLLAMKRMGL